MMAYVDLCQGEVTWFFDVDWSEEKQAFVVGEVYLLKQEAGGADVEMDADTIADFLEQMIDQGATQLPRGWGHSHVNMGTFFSVTDEDTIKELTNNTFIVALVVNKQRSMKASVKINSPYYKFRIDDLPVVVQLEYDQIPEEIEKEVAEKVKSRALVNQSKNWEQVGIGRWRLKNKHKRGVIYYLPKDRQKALEKIDTLDLVRAWDADRNKWTYVDEVTDNIYVDTWNAISQQDYEELKGDVEKSVVDDDKQRCLNCGYMRQFHNEDLCQTEIYDEQLQEDIDRDMEDKRHVN